MNIGLISTGICKGEFLETNEELEKRVKNFDADIAGCSLNEWLIRHYGIHSRLKTKKMPSKLAAAACLSAIENSSLKSDQIDFLILNTTTGDYKQPTTATRVQKLIGMRPNSFAIEVNMPCAGNVYGLAMAKSFIQSGLGSYGLVVGVDKMSTNVDQEEFMLAGMFGDAASAAVIGSNSQWRIENTILKSMDDANATLKMKASGSAFPVDVQLVQEKEHLLKMHGNNTKSFIKSSVKECVNVLLNKDNLSIQDIDQLILHQASLPILKETYQELGLKDEQVFFTLDKYGNTSSASVILTLNEYFKSTKRVGMNIFLIGMGSGLNWGGVSLKAT